MSKQKFKYREKSAADIKRRANQSSGNFDRYTKEGIQLFKPQEGKNRMRILPDTWEGAVDYSYEVWMHYGVGPEKQSYLCLNKNEKGEGNCPICAEVEELKRDGDEKAAVDLKAKKRAAVWVIDRSKESEGPKLWPMPWTLDKDIASRSVDEVTNEALPIDHPEAGFDINFNYEKNSNPTYFGVNIARRETPISDDEEEMDKWLDYIMENPVPSVFNFYSAAHIAKVFGGEVDHPNTKESTKDNENEVEDDNNSPLTEDEKAEDPLSGDFGEEESEEEEQDEKPDKKASAVRDRLKAKRSKEA